MMPRDDRNLLEVLKHELTFLEAGGYHRSHLQPWRPKLAFEDSPTCVNYETKHDRRPCIECVLMQLVPASEQGEKIPCRHIPLTSQQETLDCLYDYGTQQEIEQALRGWLRTMIQRLDSEAAGLIGEKVYSQVPVSPALSAPDRTLAPRHYAPQPAPDA